MAEPCIPAANGDAGHFGEIHQAVFRWCLRGLDRQLAASRYEEAARWVKMAAYCAAYKGGSGRLADDRLEEPLLRIGQSLREDRTDATPTAPGGCLHVFTEAYGTGGHTVNALGLMQPELAERHHVLVTSQTGDIPAELRRRVESRGGTVRVLDARAPLLERAAQLRRASRSAEFVLLHAHPEDPIPTLAFAVETTPPVVVTNHADHIFWLGASTADVVMDIRDSGQRVAQTYRGAPTSVLVPLPLGDFPAIDRAEHAAQELRLSERRRWGIPPEALVFLTVGSAYKYKPHGEYRFQSVADRLLRACPDAYFVAVGPTAEGAWTPLLQEHGHRLRTLGLQKDVRRFHALADIYLEGFPMGSMTALLEAGMCGLPCVLAPDTTPLPYRTDGAAVVACGDNPDVDSCFQRALALALDAEKRLAAGAELALAIRRVHCGSGWRDSLRALRRHLPPTHRVRRVNGVPAPTRLTEFCVAMGAAETPPGQLGNLLDTLFLVGTVGTEPVSFGIDAELLADLTSLEERLTRTGVRPVRLLADAHASDGGHALAGRHWGRFLARWLYCLRRAPTSAATAKLSVRTLEPLLGPSRFGRLKQWLRSRRPRA